jgi:hypothetical protein
VFLLLTRTLLNDLSANTAWLYPYEHNFAVVGLFRLLDLFSFVRGFALSRDRPQGGFKSRWMPSRPVLKSSHSLRQ